MKGLDLYDEGEENQQKVLSNIVGGEITRSITPTSSSLPSISVSQLRLEYPKPYETQCPTLQIQSINFSH